METNERIRSIREKTGLNRREFSDKYGIPVRTLEEWKPAEEPRQNMS